MTFEQALKRLAEKEPEKFAFSFAPQEGDKDLFDWDGEDLTSTRPPDCLTQDDIDEILASIGWEYWVVNNFRDGKWGWDVNLQYEFGGVHHLLPKKIHAPSKLEAAKQALIAVVEKEYASTPKNK